jgi:hypothetical protein
MSLVANVFSPESVDVGRDTMVVLVRSVGASSSIEWSVVVAALAILVGAAMQILTLRYAKGSAKEEIDSAQRQTKETLQASWAGTRAGIASEHLRHLMDDLARDLSEYLSNSYFVDSGYRAYKTGGGSWPGEYMENVKKEDLLYNKIRLRLNPAIGQDAELNTRLLAMRDSKTEVLWIDRRDKVIEAAQHLFDARWREIMKNELS